MMRTALLITIALTSAFAVAEAPPAARKPTLIIYGDGVLPNCHAFNEAWRTRPDFRDAVRAAFDVRFPTKIPSKTCLPCFVVEGRNPFCGFRGVDVLLWELGLPALPAESRPDASAAAAELNEVKGSLNSAMTAVVENRDALAELRTKTKATADELDAVKIESTTFRDRTEKRWTRYDELHNAATTRIDELERRPSTRPDATAAATPALVPSQHPPFRDEPPAKSGSAKRWIWTIFGIALPAAQAAGILATGGAGGIALAVLPMIFRTIARRRADKGRQSDSQIASGVDPRPTATRVVHDHSFTRVPVDAFRDAYLKTKDSFGRKNPGLVEAIETFDGMLNLILSGQNVR